MREGMEVTPSWPMEAKSGVRGRVRAAQKQIGAYFCYYPSVVSGCSSSTTSLISLIVRNSESFNPATESSHLDKHNLDFPLLQPPFLVSSVCQKFCHNREFSRKMITTYSVSQKSPP